MPCFAYGITKTGVVSGPGRAEIPLKGMSGLNMYNFLNFKI